jgi:hypothetical protein
MGQYIHHPLEVSLVYLSTISVENANDPAHTLTYLANFLAGGFKIVSIEKERRHTVFGCSAQYIARYPEPVNQIQYSLAPPCEEALL